MGACVRVRACVRACVCVSVRVCDIANTRHSINCWKDLFTDGAIKAHAITRYRTFTHKKEEEKKDHLRVWFTLPGLRADSDIPCKARNT